LTPERWSGAVRTLQAGFSKLLISLIIEADEVGLGFNGRFGGWLNVEFKTLS